MKKVHLFQFIAYAALIVIIPFIIVKIAQNEQEIKNLLFLHIIIVIPLGSILIKWYRMRNKGFNNKEILRSFVPFLKKRS